MQRDAEFIWTPKQPVFSELTFRDFIGTQPTRRDDGQNRWYLFRKTFRLDLLPGSAMVDITADSRYILFVNGQRIGRGPSRCSPDYQRVDQYDVSSQLVGGDNVIAVIVHVYGIDTAWYETVKDYTQPLFGDGGLYCVCNINDVQIVSDRTWRCTEAVAWKRHTPLSGWGQDFIEDFDARALTEDWLNAGFDDRDWDAADVLFDARDEVDLAKGFGPIRAFPTLLARDIPQLTETVVSPQSVLAVYSVEPAPALPIDERIYAEQLRAEPLDYVDNAAALLIDDATTTTVRTRAGRDTCMLLRFEALHAGYPCIDIDAQGGEVIELAVAESYPGEFVGGASVVPRLVRTSFLDCAHVFRYTARPGIQRFEKFEWAGFRYLQLVVRNAPNGIAIRHISSIATHYPVEYQGAYECSDEFLNSLWKVGRHTVLQCSHDAWEDCPGREKRQWVGDGVVRYPIAAAAFGSSTQALDRRFLMQCLESQRPDGLLQMYAPGDHKTSGVVIPDYALHYILIAHDYMMQNGDLDTLEAAFVGIQRILSWFAHHEGDRHLLVDVPYWHFIEWANVERSGAATCINALYAAALGRAAAIAEQLEYSRPAKRYAAAAAQLTAAINDQLWDATREVYVDSVLPASGKLSVKVSQQANALLLAFDIAPRERCAAIIDYITDEKRVKLTSVPPVVPAGYPFDIENDVVRCNTFFSHFLYCALANHDRFDLALALIRQHYKPMLDAGATALWESFDSTASLCHAFSATPLYQLSRYSLGVHATAPGFRSFKVAPQFHDLGFASGRYPTPNGPIDVRWQRNDDEVTVRVIVPAGLKGEFVVPAGYRLQSESIELANGTHELNLLEAGVNE